MSSRHRTTVLGLLSVAVLAIVVAWVSRADDFQLQGDAERARAPYKKYCATCHGDSGKGDGVMAKFLDPQPKDLTDQDYMATRTDRQLYLAIRDGGAAVGLSDKMAPWKSILSEQEIQDLTLLVRELGE